MHLIKVAPAEVSFKNLSLQLSTSPTSHFTSACSQRFGCLKQLLYFQGYHVFFGKHFFSSRGFTTLYFGPVRKADLFGTSSQIPRMPALGHCRRRILIHLHGYALCGPVFCFFHHTRSMVPTLIYIKRTMRMWQRQQLVQLCHKSGTRCVWQHHTTSLSVNSSSRPIVI